MPRWFKSSAWMICTLVLLTFMTALPTGPLPLRRDSAARLGVGFTVRDEEYLSARWPGDAHRFAAEFASMIG